MVGIESFKGMTAVVTGAGNGMGREIALQLAAQGCSLALCDVDESNLSQTKSMASELSDEIHILTHKVDVRDVSQVDEFFNAVMAEFGQDRINLLFNIAGINRMGFFTDLPAEQFDATFDVGFCGVINLTRRFLPVIIANKNKTGFIANMSSVYGITAALSPHREIIPGAVVYPGMSPYVSHKAAVKNFTECLYLESKAAYPHIGVGAIFPGHVGTNIYLSGKSLSNIAFTDNAMKIMRSQLIELVHLSPEKVSEMSDEQVVDACNKMFRDAPTALSPKDAAKQILDGVKRGKRRIFVGDDAVVYDIINRVFTDLMFNEYFATFVTFPWATSAGYIGKRYPGLGIFAMPVVVFAIVMLPIALIAIAALALRK